MKCEARHIAVLLLLLQTMLFSGCIHTYPDGEGEDPTLLQVGVEVDIDLSWEPEDVAFTKAGDDVYDGGYRLIIEFSRNGDTFGRCEHFLTSEEYRQGKLKLIMPFDFHAVAYTVRAWLDCAESAETAGRFYNTENLNEISRRDNHISWSGEMACGFAMTEVNLREYKDQWNARAVIPMTLTSPIGRFELVASDFDDFYSHIQNAVSKGETYSVCLSFECRIPSTFNVGRKDATTYLTSPEYYYPFPEHMRSDGRIVSGSVFVGENARTVTVRVLLFNSARMIVSKSPSIEFPLERGKVTVITGEMLTDYYTGSFNINNIWDGEIVIEL